MESPLPSAFKTRLFQRPYLKEVASRSPSANDREPLIFFRRKHPARQIAGHPIAAHPLHIHPNLYFSGKRQQSIIAGVRHIELDFSIRRGLAIFVGTECNGRPGICK